jgi:hypothetical protein
MSKAAIRYVIGEVVEFGDKGIISAHMQRDSSGQPHKNVKPAKAGPVPQAPATAPLVLVPSVDAADKKGIESGGDVPRYPEWALVLVTAVLALYTYRLFRATKDLSIEAAGDAAKNRKMMADQHLAMTSHVRATEALADAAVASERAFVFISTPHAEHNNGGQRPEPKGSFLINFINLGKTPARVDAVDAKFAVWKSRASLEAMTEHQLGTMLPIGVWLAAGAISEYHKIPCSATTEDLKPILEGRGEFVVAIVGRIFYGDVFNKTNETGFAFEWAFRTSTLLPINNSRLNYTRPRDDESKKPHALTPPVAL